MPKRRIKTIDQTGRLIDLVERLGAIALHLQTDLNHTTPSPAVWGWERNG